MKSIFITALTLLAVLGYAQETTKPAPSFKRVYVGVSTTQGVGYRILSRNHKVEINDPEEIEQYVISARNNQEKPGYSFSAGFRLGVNITKSISIETGFEYANRSYKWKMDDLTFGFEWDGNGYTPSSSGYAKFKDIYHYLDIPISVNFNLGKKKVRAAISTGTYFNVLLSKTVKMRAEIDGEKYKSTREDNYKFEAFNISPFLGIGIDYQINTLMSLRVMPMLQFQALKNIQQTPITERLYSGGINVALNFGFVDTGAKHFKYTSVIGTKKNGKPKE